MSCFRGRHILSWYFAFRFDWSVVWVGGILHLLSEIVVLHFVKGGLITDCYASGSTTQTQSHHSLLLTLLSSKYIFEQWPNSVGCPSVGTPSARIAQLGIKGCLQRGTPTELGHNPSVKARPSSF